MSEQESEILRRNVQLLANQSLQQSDPYGWFEEVYAQANGDPQQVPWAKMTIHPHLQHWLEDYVPQGDGHSALVIGCGLGDDAEALQARGFQVSAFDISPTAIAWCQKRFPHSQVKYSVANLLALDSSWNGAFDLVVESRTIQSLPLSMRPQVITTIGQLVAVGGSLLVLTWIRDHDTVPNGPPWPLSEKELAQFLNLGFSEVRRDSLFDPNNTSANQIRIEYLKSSAPQPQNS